MKKLLSFIILLSVIAFLMLFSFVPKSTLADGMIIKLYPYLDRWDYSDESNQQAFINYDNGVQKMIISVGVENENNSSDFVWLFPIPADPNKVTIDVVKNIPQLEGEEISKKAKYNLVSAMGFLQTTQIYPILLIPFSGTLMKQQDVVVYERLEKEGITSEIITAKTATGLYDYLKNKGLKIESGSIPILNHYIGKEYSFVVSWISTSENDVSFQRGVFVTFPTKDIYYPMLLTSVYGSKIVPMTIRVIGHVSPKIFQDIKPYTKTEYYIAPYSNFVDDLKNFYNKQTENIKYTKIEINAPSKLLTNDLWISNSAPLKTYYSTFFAKYPTISAILLLIISSVITGIVVGWFLFKGLRKNIFKLGLIGLSNCLSLFSLLITTIFVSTKEKDRNLEQVLNELKQKGYIWKRRFALILLIANLPFLLLSFLVILFSIIKLLFYLIRKDIFPPKELFISILDLIRKGEFFPKELLILILASVGVLIFCLTIKRIKPEDKNLFDQLKLNNYSSWSFQPKDKAKIIFVPLFSISFLIVSWLLVKLFGFTV